MYNLVIFINFVLISSGKTKFSMASCQLIKKSKETTYRHKFLNVNHIFRIFLPISSIAYFHSLGINI